MLVAGTSPAGAADWRIVIANPTIIAMVDADTFRRENTMRTFGMAFYLAKPGPDRTIGFIGATRMDCAHKLIQTTELRDMKPDGTTMPSKDLDTGFVKTEPESLGDVLYRRMCGIDLPDNRMDGTAVQVPPEVAARSVFGLLKLGLLSEPAARLAASPYEDAAAMERALRSARVAASKRPAARKVLSAQLAPVPPLPPPIVPLPAAVASGRVGRYTHSEHELVAELWLKADGRFQYGLTVGSLDEAARGRWTADGVHIHLVSEPKPVPPTIVAGTARRDPGAALSLLVTTPDGSGVPGVDLVVGFDAGDPVDGDTQADGWTLPKEEGRAPRWVEFSLEDYGLKSPRFNIDPDGANALTFVLNPADIGVVDLSGTTVDVNGQELVVHRNGGAMQFRKTGS